MKIDTFASRNKVKRKTVEKWIKDDLIPKADLEKDYIPESARPPYTKARAKNAKSIYVSMVKAAYNRKHILPVLYKICDDEFNGYIERLVNAGCIVKRISDDITYYDATLQANEVNQKFILNALKVISNGVSEGVTTAVINKIGA